MVYESGLGVDADIPRAAELYRRACTGGDPSGCQNLQGLIERGAIPKPANP